MCYNEIGDNMKKFNALNNEYELVKNYKEVFNKDEFLNLVTDYFSEFDYILGDYSYGKLRLKGFCDKGNNRFNEINDIKILDNYIKEKCAYDCGYFLLKKGK